MSSQLFQAFRDNLKVRNADDISTAYADITMRLNKDFWDQESDINHRRQIGSYGRRTAIHGVSDLDMAFEVPWKLYEQYKDREGNGPSQLLQDVRASLKKRYPKTEIKGDGQVVVINFENFVVEVLPAFVDEEEDGYRFPDSNDGGSWKICKPVQEMEAVDKRNADTNRNYKHACKMVRAWKNTHGVAISGMLIDTLAYNFFRQNDDYNDKSYGSYDQMFVSLFTYLGGLDHQEYWAAPGSGQRVHSKGKFQSKAKKAAAKCQEAVDADTDKKKAKLWREVFGRAFPLAVTETTAKSETVQASDSATTEQFIEDLYPIDIQHDLEIDCEVIEKNTSAQVGRLRRLLGNRYWLPHGRSLRFHVENCSVPHPYQLFWKIRNVGAAAERRREIRGKIVLDEGQHMRRESTTFGGDHFVEAYIVKNGVCVARDLIGVPIED